MAGYGHQTAEQGANVSSTDRDRGERTDLGDQDDEGTPDAQDERDGGGSGVNLRRWVLVAVVSVVVIYLGALAVLGGQDALEALADAALLPLLGAVFLHVVVTATWPLVHRASLRAVGEDLRYLEVLQVSMSAFTVSHTVPGGGAVGAAVAVDRLHRFGIAVPVATGAAALTGPVSLTTIAGLGAAGITTAVLAEELPQALLAVAALALVVLVVLVVGIVAALRSPSVGERIIDRVGRLHPRLDARVEEWRASWEAVTDRRPSPAAIAPVFGWSVVKWTADIAALALVFLAYGQSPRITVLLVGFGVSQVLAAVPTTPGAVGVVEGGMVGAFAALGVPVALGTTVALTYRMVEAWLPTLAGVPVLLRDPDQR